MFHKVPTHRIAAVCDALVDLRTRSEEQARIFDAAQWQVRTERQKREKKGRLAP